MPDDQKLNIGIEVTADTAGATEAKQAVQAVTSGAQQAAPALDKVASATRAVKEQAQATKPAAGDAGKALAEAGQRAEGSAKLWDGLRQTMLGGTQAIRGAGKALSGVLQVSLGATPLGRLLEMITGIGGALVMLYQIAKDVLSGVAREAEKPVDPLERIQKAVDAVSQKRKWALAAEMEEIEQKAKLALAALQRVAAIRQSEIDAREQVALAEVDNRDDMSEVAKLRAAAAIRKQAREEREQVRVETEYKQMLAPYQQAVASAEKKLADTTAALAEARAAQVRTKVAPAALRAKIDNLEDQRDTASDDYDLLRAAGGIDPAKLAASKAKIDSLDAQIAATEAALKKAESTYDQDVTAAAGKLATAENELSVATTAAKDAREALTKIGEKEVATAKSVNRNKDQAADLVDQSAIAAAERRAAQAAADQAAKDAANKEPPRFSEPTKPVKMETYAPRTQAEKAPGFGGADDAARSLQDAAGAAKENTLDPQPIIDAAQQLKQSQQDAAGQTTEAIQSAASAISETAGQVPPPADLSPLVAAQGEYHGAVMAAFADTKSQIAALKTRLNQQASQLRNLAARV